MRTKLDGWKRKGQLPAAAMKLKKLGFLGLAVALLMIATVLRMHMRDVSASLDNESPARLPGTIEEDYYFQCDRSQPRTDICNLKGEIQKNGTNSFVLYTPESFPLWTKTLKPYTRKWEEGSMRTVNTLTLTSRHLPRPTPCDVHHKVPGVIFSTSGYTGNLYHEFNDGLIPLWITTQHLNKEVVIVISSYHTWWYSKYSELVNQLTNYEIVDLERDNQIHCFPEIEAGLHIHGELAVDPNRMPDGATIAKFREFLHRAYKPGKVVIRNSKPRLTIILRKTTRRLLNVQKITELGFQLGFEVSLLDPEPTTELRKIFRLLHGTDVLLGVHGAAMTHFLFMRPGTVFIQIVPLGTDWAAKEYYGEPAIKLGLHYMAYKIQPQESSLSDRYNATDPVLVDPWSITLQGWEFVKKVYLEGQDVRPSPRRLRQFLLEAKGVVTLGL